MDDIQSWWEVPSIAHFCSLFRVAFNLLDFDIEELEEALLTDGAEDCGSSLLQELIVRLLCGCLGNNGISMFNYQMFLRRIFRQKCREYGRENPFNTDMDFQFLPLRTKVEILHALCDFRLDADDVLEVLKNLDSDSLRVHPLGYDENRSAYWYFYGTRLYREDYPKARKKKKKLREREKHHGRKMSRDSSGGESEPEMGCGEWQVVCYTESDWERLSLKMEDSHCKEERALHTVLAEDFLPEIPRLFEEKEKLQRKRLLELQPRRQSSRIEKLKHQKENEKKLAQKKVSEEEDKDKVKYDKEDREVAARQARERRALLRLRSRSNSTCESSVEGGGSVVENVENSQPRGRQTNNSLSSATGQIIIQPSRQKLRTSQVFRQSEEDLQTGLYKILDRIKNHDDAWPFMDPVEEEYAPRYYSVIAKPMDLQRMEDKLDAGEYLNFQEFKADFQLIVDNCRQYNGSDNEYTEMAGKLQEAFEAAVDRYLETEISTDEEVAVEFPGEQKGRRRKLSQPARETPPESSHVSVESEPEDRTKDEESQDSDSQRAESQNSDKPERRRKLEHKKTENIKPRKKAGIIKNVADIEALELATEQTLKDINKWLDDTPRFSEFSSASNSPSQLPLAEEADGVAARIENEYRARLKLDKPLRPKDKMDFTRRRFFKDQGMLKRRREIQRTIDRLQPGKSKGNLISNIGVGKSGDDNIAPGNPLGTKVKEQRITTSVKSEEATPKLSLGTVLANDVLGLGQHNFIQSNDKKDSIETGDDSSEENILYCVDSDEKRPVDVEVNVKIEDTPAKKAKLDKVVTGEEDKKSSLTENVSKLEKCTPNLSAWFKAFGAPKSQPVVKKKNDSDDPKISPKAIEIVKTPTKDDELNEEDKEKKTSVVPPLQSPARRQRKASTGSSVSERSSFSQDPTDPLADGSSPRPSLDEPYLSPQPDPTKTPYHQSPINGTIRVGFYQDTSFARGSSDKSSSPRDLPNCSPRDPCSPRDLPNCSPREPMNSPKTDYPMYTSTSVPRYHSSVVTTSPMYESPLSPYPAHIPYYDTSKSLSDSYRSDSTSNIDKPVPSVFPVKKRVYSEIDSPQMVKSNSEHFRGGGSFTPTRGAMEQDRGFTPTPGRMPTQTISRVPDPSRHSYPQDTALAMGLAHHPMSHHLIDPYVEERLLSSPYFSSDNIYNKNSPTTTMSHPIFSQSSSAMTTTSYNREEQESAVSYSNRPDLSITSSSLTYSDARAKVGENASPDYSNSALPLAVNTKSSPAINYSNRNPEMLSPCSNRSSASPINFSSSELTTRKVPSPPVNYLSRQEIIANKPPMSTIGYSKLSSDLLSGKVRPPSPLSFAANRPLDILPPKINSPFRQISELPSPINYNHAAGDLTGKMPVPSPLSYSQADILSGKMNYNLPMTDIIQNSSRYNYPMSDLIPSKTPVSFNLPMADLIQSKGSTGYTNRSVDLLTSNVGLSNYNRQISELMPTREMAYASMARPMTSNKPVEPMLTKSQKKSNKKKKTNETTAASSTSFQQYLGQSSTEAIALKSSSVVPGSAFNFGPPPLKDSYATYLEDIRQSGYYMPHPESSSGTKTNSPGPHTPASPFPFLGQRGPTTYPHHFMNASYQQYLQRHPDELLRPMMIHQGLLPPTGYPPGYLDAINRSSWL